MIVNPHYLKVLLLTLFVFVAIGLLGHESRKHFYLNLSPSEPLGLYKLVPESSNIRRGDLVLMRTPKKFEAFIYGRKWLPAGWPLLKEVGAISGDKFCIIEGTFTVNGSIRGPVYERDSKGISLPQLHGCYIVRPGYFLPVATRIPNSFDGRYMGDISEAFIIAKARPILTN